MCRSTIRPVTFCLQVWLAEAQPGRHRDLVDGSDTSNPPRSRSARESRRTWQTRLSDGDHQTVKLQRQVAR